MDLQQMGSFEEYLKLQTKTEMTVRATVNITKEEMIAWGKELGVEDIKDRDTKLHILDRLLDIGVEYIDIYNRFKQQAFGIHPTELTKKYNLTKHQRNKMEKQNFFTVMYYKEEKVFTGTYAKVPYYSAEEYFDKSIEEVEKWKTENIRNYVSRTLKDGE